VHIAPAFFKGRDDLHGKAQKRYIFIAVSVLIPLLCVYYVDSDSNIRQGMNVFEALFSGRFFEFYRINEEMHQSGQLYDTANYSILVQLMMGIWQLPLYLIEKLTGGNVLDHFAARVWGKSMLLPVFAWSGVLVKRLAGLLGFSDEQKETAVFLYLTNALTTLSAFLAGQIDLLGLCFTMLAMCFLLEKKKIPFLIAFAVAAQFKSFAYLVFLPVLLLREKNLFKLAGTMAVPVVFGYLIELPFKIADPVGAASRKPRLWMMLDFLTRSRVNLVGGIEIPLVFLVLGSFCMIAYFSKTEDERETDRKSICLAIPGMLSVLLCTKSNVYWSVWLVPFYTLLLVGRKEKQTIRLVLETAAVMSLTVAYMVLAAPMFGRYDGMLPDLLLHGALPDPMLSERFAEYVSQEKYFGFWTLSFAAFIVWAAGFMIVHRKGAEQITTFGETALKETPWIAGDTRVMNGLLLARAVGMYLLCDVFILATLLSAFFRL